MCEMTVWRRPSPIDKDGDGAEITKEVGTVMRSFSQNLTGTEFGLEDQTIEEKADGAQRSRAEPEAIDESCNVQEARKQGR